VGRKDNSKLVNRAVDEIADDLAWTGAFGAQGPIDQAAKKYGIPAVLRKAVTPEMIRSATCSVGA
jgi:hypothetical protein